jgi:signal transduction histidine kinase
VTDSAKLKNGFPVEASFPDNTVSLKSILCTEELRRRPSRPPQYEKENHALVALASALADSPGTILQTLAETIAVAEAEWTHVLVAVRDSGPGLDPKSLNLLFEAFYTTKPQGLGMGLAISRSIIEAHGGRLWARANAPRGAIFEFALPMRDERTSSGY